MLFLISLGLYSLEDISNRAINAMKKCDIVYFEDYTSFYREDSKGLSAFIGKDVKKVGRKDVEEGNIVEEAKKKNVGLLVIGDVFSATTHISLYLEAIKENVKVNVIHGSSILTAIGETGLSLYRFGSIASIPFNRNVKAPYEVLKKNLKNGYHTLFLFDIEGKVSINDAILYLIKQGMSEEQICVGCWQLGGDKEIKTGKAKELMKVKIEKFPQCLIVPAKKLHFIEEDFLKHYGKS